MARKSPRDGSHGRERLGRECGPAARPCSTRISKKYAQGPLGYAVSGEADDDARKELHRGQGKRHQQDSEHDGNDRHDRAGDPREDHLTYLRVPDAREEQHPRFPLAERRIGLLDPGEQPRHTPAPMRWSAAEPGSPRAGCRRYCGTAVGVVRSHLCPAHRVPSGMLRGIRGREKRRQEEHRRREKP